jgi:hypothetical protein
MASLLLRGSASVLFIGCKLWGASVSSEDCDVLVRLRLDQNRHLTCFLRLLPLYLFCSK